MYTHHRGWGTVGLEVHRPSKKGDGEGPLRGTQMNTGYLLVEENKKVYENSKTLNLSSKENGETSGQY